MKESPNITVFWKSNMNFLKRKVKIEKMLKIISKPKPLILCILDGWGIAPHNPGNAISLAQPVNFNSLWFSYPHTILLTSGQSVGLPAAEAGNSEVGHLNLGAGRIVFQDLLRINLAITNGSFFENEAFLKACKHRETNDSRIHLMGLVSPGVVHSEIKHLYALLKLLQQESINPSKIKIHLFTDGRDSPPTSAKIYLQEILKRLREENLGEIATLSGRYFAMDRDNRWDRTEKAYTTLLGKSPNLQTDPVVSIEKSYSEGKTDEFIEPIVFVDNNGNPVGPIASGDSVIFFNYRPDRARQLTQAFVLENFKSLQTSSGEGVKTFSRGPKLANLFFVTMTEYEKGLPVSAVAFPHRGVVMPVARVFSEINDRQLHIAETEKYAHVTYFFNGGQELPFNGEDRILVNSKKVASYDQAPEMSTPEITKHLIGRINNRVYDFIVVNLANADMVGHTGNLNATIQGIQAIDIHLGIIAKAALSAGGGVIITADHGNAEEMINPKTARIDTEHNANPAPCILVFKELRGVNTQLPRGILADIAPTILGILKISKPSQMTGRNLLD